MKKIFITYGDERFKQALNRINKEANQLGIFDKIILYTPKDLPPYINASPLMAFQKGGGFWIWKPYLILKTLQEQKNDAIVIYVDAGCTLGVSKQWEFYFQKMTEYDTIVFKYQNNFDYGWSEMFNCNSVAIKHWTKKNTLHYFDVLFENSEWRNYEKIMGGFIIAKKVNNIIINEWLKISLLHPELIIDPFGNEINNQYSFYTAHRHDQSILTPLVYHYSKTNSDILILEETAESGLIEKRKDIAVLASRKNNIKVIKITYKTKAIRIIKKIIGERIYNVIHGR